MGSFLGKPCCSHKTQTTRLNDWPVISYTPRVKTSLIYFKWVQFVSLRLSTFLPSQPQHHERESGWLPLYTPPPSLLGWGCSYPTQRSPCGKQCRLMFMCILVTSGHIRSSRERFDDLSKTHLKTRAHFFSRVSLYWSLTSKSRSNSRFTGKP